MLALHLGGRSEPLENAQASERKAARGVCVTFHEIPQKESLLSG